MFIHFKKQYMYVNTMGGFDMLALIIFSLIYLAMPRLSCGTQDLSLQHVTSSLWHVGSGSLTRDRTQVPCIGSLKSQPRDHQGHPGLVFQKSANGSPSQTLSCLVLGIMLSSFILSLFPQRQQTISWKTSRSSLILFIEIYF